MKVAIYARVSTINKQDYNRQIEELQEIAIGHGYKLENIDVFAEKISGYKKKDSRPQLDRLLGIIDKETTYYKSIYTSEISRIGREPTQTRKIIDDLSDKKVPIYIQSLNQSTLDKDGKRNMMMNIILQVLIEYANMEAETFKIRSKSGLLRSAKQGKAGGGASIAYGYKKNEDNGMLVIDDEESLVVKQVYTYYLEGYGAKLISQMLNENNTPTRMNKTHKGKTVKFNIEKTGESIQWSDVTVLSMLNNSLYKGDRKFKGKILPAPAIVSAEVWDKCQIIMKTKTRVSSTEHTYLLKDLLKCGCCQRNYFGRYKKTTGGDNVYTCSSKYGNNENCKNPSINIDLIESVFYNLFSRSSILPDFIEKENERKELLIGQIYKLQDEQKVYEKQLKTKQIEVQKISELFLAGVIPDISEVKKMTDKVKNEIEILKSKLKNISEDLKFKDNAKNNKKVDLDNFKKLKGNRTMLAVTFKQFIHKIVINSINPSNFILKVNFGSNGVVSEDKFLIVDKTALRSRYGGDLMYYILDSKGSIKYRGDKLVSDISNDIDELKRTTKPIILKETITIKKAS